MLIARRPLLGAAASLLAAPALAQGTFPNRPIRMIVPIAPGGANDLIARMVSEKLSPILGQTIVVENRPGAGGNIGGQAVAQAEKDGHTLLFTSANVLTANTYLYGSRMPYEPLRAFAPIGKVGTGTIMMVCNSNAPYRSFADIVAAAKRQPGRLTMGSSGTGTISHLYMEKVKREAGIDITHVPYRGGGPAFQDLLAGNIDIMFDVIPAMLSFIRAGQFRPLVAGSAKRVDYVPELKDVPGMDEALPGKGIDALNWWCVVAPAGTPDPTLATIHAGLKRVLDEEEIRQKLLGLSVFPALDASPAAFGAFWRAQDSVWKDLVVSSGATAE